MAPAVRIFNVVYKIVVYILSYGLIGLSLLCLLAIGAELFHYGITKEGIAYFVLAAISFVVRWALIQSVGIVDIVSNTVNVIADPSFQGSYNYAIEEDQ